MGRDHLLRQLSAGDTADYIGRDIVGGLDYLERELVPVWAVSTTFAVGEHVELSTGEALQATVAGTTDATTEPIAPGFGNTVVDGTVTWEQITVGAL